MTATFVGGEAIAQVTSQKSLEEKLAEKKEAFLADPNDPDKLVWYGRFLAYSGRLDEAFDLYQKGSQQFPQDAGMLRHRGHRLISQRLFAKAIVDLEKAARLIEGNESRVSR